jgi:hypothetical protein
MFLLGFTRGQVTDNLITQSISKDLKNVDDQRVVAHVTVLAELAHKVPDAFESKSEEIMNHIVKQILMTPSLRDPVRVRSGCLFLRCR